MHTHGKGAGQVESVDASQAPSRRHTASTAHGWNTITELTESLLTRGKPDFRPSMKEKARHRRNLLDTLNLRRGIAAAPRIEVPRRIRLVHSLRAKCLLLLFFNTDLQITFLLTSLLCTSSQAHGKRCSPSSPLCHLLARLLLTTAHTFVQSFFTSTRP